MPSSFGQNATGLRQIAHKAIDGVTGDIEAFHFNRSVARIHELANAIGDFKAGDDSDNWAHREALETLIILSGPMMPHLAEEMWKALGHEGLLADASWPSADASLIVEDSVTIAVQVNGKMRAKLELPRDGDKAAIEAAAMADENVQRAMADLTVRKVIVVPNKIVNIVVG